MQTADPIRVQVIFRPAQIAAIEELRRRLPDIPSRAETIRRLCDEALARQQHQAEG